MDDNEEHRNTIVKSDIEKHINDFKINGHNSWLRYGYFGGPSTIDGFIIDIEKNTSNCPLCGLELLLRFNELKQQFFSEKEENPFSTFEDNRGQIVFVVYKLKNIEIAEIFEKALVFEASKILAISRVMTANPENAFHKRTKLEPQTIQEKIFNLRPFDPEKFVIKEHYGDYELHYNDHKKSFIVPLYALHQDLNEKTNSARITGLKTSDGLIFVESTHTFSDPYGQSYKKVNVIFNAENLEVILKQEKIVPKYFGE